MKPVGADYSLQANYAEREMERMHGIWWRIIIYIDIYSTLTQGIWWKHPKHLSKAVFTGAGLW